MGELPGQGSLEQELAEAQQRGRWLSDDERAQEEEQEAQSLAEQQAQDSRRLRLTLLTLVSLLIPPLWPLAFALTLYLLFPRTSTRLFLAAGVGATLLAVAAVGLSLGLLIWMLTLVSHLL